MIKYTPSESGFMSSITGGWNFISSFIPRSVTNFNSKSKCGNGNDAADEAKWEKWGALCYPKNPRKTCP